MPEPAPSRRASGDQDIGDANADLPNELRALFAAAREFYGVQTVGDALRLELTRIAELRGIESALSATPIHSVAGDESVRGVITTRLGKFLGGLNEARQRVLFGRIWATERQTLESLGHELAVTRERVRQIETHVISDLEKRVGQEIRVVASFIRERLPILPEEVEVRRLIAEHFGRDAPTAADLGARKMLTSRLGYTYQDGLAFSKEAMAEVKRLKAAGRDLADDVGLVDEEHLREALQSKNWNRCFDDLIRSAGFCKLYGYVALRATRTASVKAALMQIGRPATKEEVAEVVALGAKRVGGLLSAMSSVGRVDAARWWLKDEVEEEYKGIPEEIAARIRKDGGATTVNRLLEELPRRFGVNIQSVRAYIRTQQFVVQGGYVSLADPSVLELRGVWEVVDGYDGDSPYWTFVVEDRYFSGYSVVGFPVELAQLLGCKPNGRRTVSLGYPEGCGQLSVSWRLSSLTGASLGYVADPLRRLSVQAGDRVRLIIRNTDIVELRRD